MNWHSKKDHNIALVILGASLLLIVIVWGLRDRARLMAIEERLNREFWMRPGQSAPRTPFCTGSNSEIVTAQIGVRDLLKAPSTARFVLGTESWKPLADDECVIQGKVDAQNSFGAMIRVHWVAVLGREGFRRGTIFE